MIYEDEEPKVEQTLEDLITEVTRLSTNHGIQITTYVSGRSEVGYFPKHRNGAFAKVQGPSIRFVLEKILADYTEASIKAAAAKPTVVQMEDRR